MAVQYTHEVTIKFPSAFITFEAELGLIMYPYISMEDYQDALARQFIEIYGTMYPMATDISIKQINEENYVW